MIALTDQHIAEVLSRAYVCAIAGHAGLNLAIRGYDYGVDGSFEMTPEALLNYAQNRELRVAEVIHYLQQNRWIPVSYPNSWLLVFEKGVDDQGKPIQIVLPSQDEHEDRPYLLAKAVNLLPVLEIRFLSKHCECDSCR